jgi:hypothetical protein
MAAEYCRKSVLPCFVNLTINYAVLNYIMRFFVKGTIKDEAYEYSLLFSDSALGNEFICSIACTNL